MPIYKYTCDNCGHEMEQFLHDDKESVSMVCKRCNKKTIATQVRDQEVEYHKTGYVDGTIKHEETRA